MKNLFILFILLIPLHSFSQNILFFNFGEKYEKVIENLNKFPVDSLEMDTKLKPLTAYYDGFIARYHFNQTGKLYKVEVSKNYDVKKNSKEAVNGALDYFDEIHATMNNTNIKGTKVYRAKQKEHYYEMQEVNYADNDIDVFLVGWSGNLSPEAWIGNDVVSDEDLLEVHDARTAQREAEMAKNKRLEEEKMRVMAEKEELALKELQEKAKIQTSPNARVGMSDSLVAKSIHVEPEPVEEQKADAEVKVEQEDATEE
jgi:hypothetical protein